MLRFCFAIWMVLATCGIALGQELAVTQQGGLSFGDVYPEMSKSISYTDADAAAYMVSGEAGREVQLTFQLPEVLHSTEDETLPIEFNSTDAAYHQDQSPNYATAFDPANGVVTTLNAEGELFIWLGGTVFPDGTQSGGDFSNDIILEVTYTN